MKSVNDRGYRKTSVFAPPPLDLEPLASDRKFTRTGFCERFPYRVFFPPVLFFAVFFPLVSFSGCSSAPKKPSEIFTDRNMATNQLNLANLTANRGRYEDAMLIVDDAWRLALTTDDPPLRIKTLISRGNILFSLRRHEEAFLAWESASSEGDDSNEPALAALARVYAIRARLVLLDREDPAGSENGAALEEYKARISAEMAAFERDDTASAAGNVTLGMAEKLLGNWDAAENTLKRALDIHEENLSLEDAAYDWFLIASVRSLAGNYESSIEALRTAITFDRRAENGFGLAASWRAAGEVYRKAGKTEESRAALRRSADIYRALGLNDTAEKLEEQLSGSSG